MKSELETLRERNREHNSEIEDLKDQIGYLENQIDDLNDEIKELENENLKMECDQTRSSLDTSTLDRLMMFELLEKNWHLLTLSDIEAICKM